MLPSFEHLATLTDDVGTIQHAFGTVPNRSTGYCTDDVARAFIVAVQRLKLEPAHHDAERIARTSLAFLLHAQLPDGRFHNFMSYGREWLDEVGTEDSCGRAIWALGYASGNSPIEDLRTRSRIAFERALPSIESFTYLRPIAYASIGLHASGMQRRNEGGMMLARLRAAFAANTQPQWRWYEDTMTYDNARLPQAELLLAGLLEDSAAQAEGLEALAFFVEHHFEGSLFSPVGNRGWFSRGATKPGFDQQPLEATAAIDALLAAESIAEASYHVLAQGALQWFYGQNAAGIKLVDERGGCSDGLAVRAASENQGAESTLAYLAAAQAMALQ